MPTYKGFNFTGGSPRWIDVEGSGENFGAHNGDFALTNASGGIVTITESGSADFTFDGLWAKKWGTSPNSWRG